MTPALPRGCLVCAINSGALVCLPVDVPLFLIPGHNQTTENPSRLARKALLDCIDARKDDANAPLILPDETPPGAEAELSMLSDEYERMKAEMQEQFDKRFSKKLSAITERLSVHNPLRRFVILTHPAETPCIPVEGLHGQERDV
jgi:hypothetical protein